jgi:hypothetical protein
VITTGDSIDLRRGSRRAHLAHRTPTGDASMRQAPRRASKVFRRCGLLREGDPRRIRAAVSGAECFDDQSGDHRLVVLT